MKRLEHAAGILFIILLRIYRWFLSPLKNALFGTGASCRFTPTCSCYAMEAIQNHGAIHGTTLTARRLLRCHPWGGAGYDPVPTPSHPVAAPRQSAADFADHESGALTARSYEMMRNQIS